MAQNELPTNVIKGFQAIKYASSQMYYSSKQVHIENMILGLAKFMLMRFVCVYLRMYSIFDYCKPEE